MSGGRIHSVCRRVAGRSYRRQRAEMWASVYCAAFDVEGAGEDESAAADDGTDESRSD